MDEHAQHATGQRTPVGRHPLRLAAAAAVSTLVLAAALAGCSASSDSGASGAGGASVATAPQPADGSRALDPGTGSGGATGQPADGTATGALSGEVSGSSGGSTAKSPEFSTGVLANRSVVRTASLTVRVEDVLVTSAKAESLAEGLGGFVSGEKMAASPEQPGKSEAVLTLRVPADRLPALLVSLRGLGTLLDENQSADDVTGQVIDVAARISAQKASVARIRALMAQATTLGQVVQIEGELTSRQAALESLEGQAAALADQTTLATATVTIVGPKAVPPATHHESTPTGFGTGLSKGWHAFTTAGAWLLTAVGVLLPFLLVLVPVGAVGWALARRRTKVGPAPTTTEPPAPAAA